MRFVCVVWLVAGCHFNHGNATGDAPSADVARGDTPAPNDGLVDAASDAPPDSGSAFLFCNPADLDLRACYAFDGNGQDGSSYNHDAALGGTYTFMGGVHGSAIATIASSIVVASDINLTISEMTLKASVHPTALPAATARAGIIDSTGYRVFIEAGGVVRCALNDGSVQAVTTAAVPINAWTRIGCIYNGAALTVYFDGVQKATTGSTVAIDAVTGNLTIGQNEPSGDNFVGLIDEVQIWGSIVTP
jgi:hypothetical protein